MRKIVFLFAILTSLVCNSQVPRIEILWDKLYGGSGAERCRMIQSTLDGGYILGGWTLSPHVGGSVNHGIRDGLLVKIDNIGNVEWQRTYGGSLQDAIHTLHTTLDGGYIFGGWTESSDGDIQSGNKGKTDSWVVKIDNVGNIQWEKTYGGSGVDALQDMKPTLDGGYILGSFTWSNDGDIQSGNNGEIDLWVVKIDSIGNLEWEKTYGGDSEDYFWAIESFSDGSYLLVGEIFSNNGDIQSGHHGGGNDGWVVKIDNVGNILWERTFGGSGREILSTVISTLDGGYLFGGESNSTDGDIQSGNKGDFDTWIVKTDNNGNILWEKTYGGSKKEELALSIVPNPIGGYIFAATANSDDGDVQSGNKGYYDYWIVGIDESGNIQWEKSFGGSRLDRPWDIIPSNDDGCYLIVGETDSNDGDISSHPSNDDFWLMKVTTDSLAFEEYQNEEVKIYPNPISDNGFTIYYPIKDLTYLRIIDSRGRFVLQEKLIFNQTFINMSNVDNGLYFIQIIKGSKIIHNQKVIK